jgi:hypothetical protein
MELEKEVIPYLKDEKFSAGLSVKTSMPQAKLTNRLDYICDYAKGKKIVHVGCLDHLPLIEKKIRSGTWLHKLLDEVAKKQVGIDINKEGIEKVKKTLGYENIFFEDILSDEPPGEFISQENWDLMILGEILEHVNNPVEFLIKLRLKYAVYVREILISVPNAFALENFLYALRHIECINTDHRSWFSIYTLTKNLTLAGFGSFDFDFVTSYPSDYKNISFKKMLINKYPSLRSTIVVNARFNEHEP